MAAGPGYDARSKIILDLYLSECAALARPRRGEVASCQRAGLSPPTLQLETPACNPGIFFAKLEKIILIRYRLMLCGNSGIV